MREACRTASPTLAAVKRLTRAGMGRCQGRFCAGPLTRLVAAEGGPAPDVGAFFAPRPPARPVPLGAIAVEKAEWGGHRQSAPPAVSPRVTLKREPFGRIDTDVVVIGAGVVGSTVAWELARSGVSVTVVDRHEPNVQASGANAGSLHVQLLSFDFGAKAQAGGRPAAEVLRIAPVSIRLWKEIEALSGADFEMATPGGVMVGESEADMAFLAQKTALEKSYGIDSELIGANELRSLEPLIARISPAPRSAATRARSIRSARRPPSSPWPGPPVRGSRPLPASRPSNARARVGASRPRPARWSPAASSTAPAAGPRASRPWRRGRSPSRARPCR